MTTNNITPEIQPDAIVISSPHMKLEREPEEILAEASKAAKALRDLVESKPKKVVFRGKTFLQFEDWLTVARFYGISVAARETTFVERGLVQGYECHAEAILVSTGQVIGAGQAECLDDEENWNTRAVYDDNGRKVGEKKVPLFQLRSMAQTRAQAKALRSILSWVVVLAGYAPTPAEEMDETTAADRRGTSNSSSSNSRKRLASARVEEMLGEIRRASSLDQLWKVYKFAYREAHEAGDRPAMAAYIQAKDIRKRGLRK